MNTIRQVADATYQKKYSLDSCPTNIGRNYHCTSQATASVISKSVVRPFGSGLITGGIITMLENKADVEVILDDPFRSSTSQPSSSKKTSLAIVGIACRSKS